MPHNTTIALIPARGGSKGIPDKNIKPLAGMPLIAHTIRAAREAREVDRVIVSTDDSEIAEVAQSYGAKIPFMRPANLARDSSPTEPVIEHAIRELRDQQLNFNDLILLQPTSPLRNAAHIDEAYGKYRTNDADSLTSVWPCYDDLWTVRKDEAEKLTPSDAPSQRQRREPVYVTNGAIYITDVDRFMQSTDLTNGHTMLYEMSQRESIDIDTPFDLWLAEQIISEHDDD